MLNSTDVTNKTKTARNKFYNSYENTLRDKLGCKVQVSKDKITIPFDSDGDLARIFEILNIDLEDEY